MNNLGRTRRVLYHLDKLQGRKGVVVCEGEKDVDRLWALGIPATTAPNGATTTPGRNWRPEYTEQLIEAGVKRLPVIPDNDKAGHVYASDAAAACHAVGIAVKVVELPGLPTKGDVSVWLDAGHTKEELVAVLKAAPLYEPAIEGDADGDRIEAPGVKQPPGRRRHPELSWPAPLAPAALVGVFGDIVRMVAPHTEADPVALLVHSLVAFGNIIGRHAYFMVGATRHNLNLFALMVGDTAKARKGTSQQEILRFFRALDSTWGEHQNSLWPVVW